ncbi:precorrin-3B synthase [Gephyromycinifex aptenodytis]|uniref:precorrin-3B synthase n=1 Tax=Gephyromycinifex aptenodytis TaxID=2716227 RepID=UPI0014452C24|nr:precorrin-3B synthase [Gephyromycinifex aptenodytis]
MSPTPGAATSQRSARRDVGDRCPGAVRLHEAADGALARIRLPGGALGLEQAQALAHLAEELGDGDIHLTARGNAEIRGLDPTSAQLLTTRLSDAGLLPSVAHERMRNILVSSLAGLDGTGHLAPAGGLPLVAELDALLVSEPDCAALSGRFLFGIDDGRGDVVVCEPDLTAVATSAGLRLLLGGHPLGLVVQPDQTPRALQVLALTFLHYCRSRQLPAWRVADLDAAALRELGTLATNEVASALPTQPDPDPSPATARRPEPQEMLGLIGTDPVALGVGLPLGVAPGATWEALAQIAAQGEGVLRTTSTRGVIIGGLSPAHARRARETATELGLVTDQSSDYARVSACTGLPGCASSRADLRSDIRQVAGRTSEQPVGSSLLHVSGCERRCGHPRTPHLEAVATGSGYALARADGAPATGESTGEQIETMYTVMNMWRNA